MSKNITKDQLRQVVRKVIQERFAKNEAEVITEAVEENAPETKEVIAETKKEVSNDQWYQNSLFESLKRKWAK